MESACVNEHNTVIDELTQGIRMNKELRFHMKMLYLFLNWVNLLASLAPSLPKSKTSTCSWLQSKEFVCDQYFVHHQVAGFGF